MQNKSIALLPWHWKPVLKYHNHTFAPFLAYILKTEFIKLDQLLKWAGMVGDGGEAKHHILEGNVRVNGETEKRRGKKIYENDIIELDGEKIKIVRG